MVDICPNCHQPLPNELSPIHRYQNEMLAIAREGLETQRRIEAALIRSVSLQEHTANRIVQAVQQLRDPLDDINALITDKKRRIW